MQPNDQITAQEAMRQAMRQQKALESLDAKWREQLKAARKDLTLRQWAVDTAIRAGTHEGKHLMSYQSIYEFISVAYDLPDADNGA